MGKLILDGKLLILWKSDKVVPAYHESQKSAIIYTGYDYQTLQGVKLLAEWLHSPSQYVRVAFEADTDGNETPEGIDDVVCERPNGVQDFWQVKFTPSLRRAKTALRGIGC